MSVKKMIEMYVNYGLSDETWDMMYQMSIHGLISRENWVKFFDTCKDWTWSDDEKDFINGNNVIVNGDGKVLYFYDENGNMKKAA